MGGAGETVKSEPSVTLGRSQALDLVESWGRKLHTPSQTSVTKASSPPTAQPRVAIVEDEAALVEVLQYNLERAGLATDVYARGDTALEGLRSNPPDAILLDLMLPGLDGLELARTLKRIEHTSQIPIIVLTARGEEVDRIVGLELGADDYITKPFSPREVVLRVKAVLRRARVIEAAPLEPDENQWLEAGSLRLDREGYRLFVDAEEVALTPTEFRLLRFLLERKGRVFTRGQLLTDVWAYAEEVDSRTVDTHIRRLRKKLGSEGDRIETVVGIGYRLRR
jgi:two-component system phosphate regulon response regulator PhoB